MDGNLAWKTSLTAFKSLARFLESLSDEEKDSLAKGLLKIKFELQNSGPVNQSRGDWSPLEVISMLNTFSSREEADSWLCSKSLSKRQLQDALKSLDIPWDKLDKVEKLREKIVEGTIGFRLRSRAIQGS